MSYNGYIDPTYSPAPGIVAPGDKIQQAIQKNDGNIGLINKLVAQGYITAKLYRWFLKFSKSPLTAIMLWVGDSTSDFTSNAVGIPEYIQTKYTFPGDPLEGFNTSTNMPNFGANGMTLSFWLATPTAANGLNNIVAANPDLIIFSFLINDVRQNLVDVTLGKAMLIQAIESIRAALPNTDIVLRMPNSFSIPTTNFYVKLTGPYAPTGGYSSLAVAAQAQSDVLYQIYFQLKDYWDNVYMYNSQDLTFGRTAIALPNILHSDELHPSYSYIIDDIVKTIGLKAPFSKPLAVNAITQNYLTPWTVYSRVFENTDYFTKIGTGKYGTQTSTFWDIVADSQGEALKLATNVRVGDIMVIGNTVFPLPAFTISNPSSGYYRIAYAIPANTITGGQVAFYRHNYNFNVATEAYVNNRGAYPYLRKVIINGGGTNYIRVTANFNGYPLTDFGATPIQAGRLQFNTSNTMILADGTIISFAGLSFFWINDTTYQINITGSYAGLAGQIAVVAGTQAYEDPYPLKTGFQGLYLDLATPVIGTMGVFNGRFFNVRTKEGKVGIPNLVFLNAAEPAGNTIANTTTKTTFADVWPIPISTLFPQKEIQVVSYLLLNTLVGAPGTLTLTVSVGTTVMAQTVITLASTMVNQPIKLDVSLFAKSIDGSQTIVTYVAFGSVDFTGLLEYPMVNTGTNLNNGSAYNLGITAQFSVADPNNNIVMKTLRVLSNNP
jgi:hypothetical protein